MDPVDNPFSPGAGTLPPELTGRSDVIDDAAVALRRTLAGKPVQSSILLGLRGTGKTVLLNRIHTLSEDLKLHTTFIEGPEEGRLVQLLFPRMLAILRRVSGVEAAKALASKALAAMKNVAAVFKVSYEGFDLAIDADPGVADTGDLEIDLPELFEAIGKACKAADTGWVLIIDEVQYLSSKELASLIAAIHKMNQRALPILFFAGGLPQIARLTGEAKSYSERLFLFPPIGALEPADARDAIELPLKALGAKIDDDALVEIIKQTQGYPFFLQEWGHHAWNIAPTAHIKLAHVQEATTRAHARLDEGFFRMRMDRLTPKESDYVKAMGSMGKGPHAASDVAKALGRTPQAVGTLREAVIKKGMIYTPGYGLLDFTVPNFHEFLARTEQP